MRYSESLRMLRSESDFPPWNNEILTGVRWK
jgi:hypothetical protein